MFSAWIPILFLTLLAMLAYQLCWLIRPESETPSQDFDLRDWKAGTWGWLGLARHLSGDEDKAR